MPRLLDHLDVFYLEHRRCGELDLGILKGGPPAVSGPVTELLFGLRSHAHGFLGIRRDFAGRAGRPTLRNRLNVDGSGSHLREEVLADRDRQHQ